jgi:hypothetical protein
LLPNLGLDPIPKLLFDAPFKEVTFGQLLFLFMSLSSIHFANISNPFIWTTFDAILGSRLFANSSPSLCPYPQFVLLAFLAHFSK